MVTAVGNGIDAIDAANNADRPVDLIVLDLMLPQMSGYEVCEKVRQQGLAMPILMLSARTLSEDKTRGFDVGANQYMVSRLNWTNCSAESRTCWRRHVRSGMCRPVRIQMVLLIH